MHAHHTEPVVTPSPALTLLAREPETAWEARGFGDLVPSATLAEARARRDELSALLRRERAAAADFLLALADFDRRRGWERLGHASLFAFLTRELGLSSGAAQLRLSAARLLPRHQAVEGALRSGRLCISAVGQLARVLTPANEAEVLPRFLGRSAREAQEVAAAILPCPAPPRREVITRVAASHEPPAPSVAAPAPLRALAGADAPLALGLRGPDASSAEPAVARPEVTADSLHTHEVTLPLAGRPRAAEVEPLDAESRRLHLTVSRAFLEKVAAARTGLSRALPGATAEQVLEAALDLLLAQQARRKAIVKRRRHLRLHLAGRARPHRAGGARRRDVQRQPALRVPCPQSPCRRVGPGAWPERRPSPRRARRDRAPAPGSSAAVASHGALRVEAGAALRHYPPALIASRASHRA
jgi:hypothetical protein